MLTATKGTAVLNTIFREYAPWCGDILTRENGSLVGHETGQARLGRPLPAKWRMRRTQRVVDQIIVRRRWHCQCSRWSWNDCLRYHRLVKGAHHTSEPARPQGVQGRPGPGWRLVSRVCDAAAAGDLRSHGLLTGLPRGAQVTAYAVESVQQRGRLFVEPGQDIYESQVVGIHQRQGDLKARAPAGRLCRSECTLPHVCLM
jgi:hypothetical protein